MPIKMLLKLMSILAMLLSIFMLPSLAVAIFSNDTESIQTFVVSVGLLVIPALFIFLFCRNTKGKMSIKGGLFLVTFSWICISAYSSLPFYLSGTFDSWARCFFEATSGITTTGATVMEDIEIHPKAILLWRSMTHWLGGVGIIVLTVALLPLLGIGGLQLFKAEATGIDGMESDKMTPRIAQTAKILWFIYVILTFTSFLMLRLGGMTTFDAINHAMSALASGGFSTKNASIGHYQSAYIQWVVTFSMFFAGVNFSLFFLIFSGKLKSVYKNSELRAYLIIVFCTGTGIAVINYMSGIFNSFGDSVRHGFFQTIALMTSTGFCTVDYEFWPYVSQYLLFVLIFVGGCAGSTAGGFKVIRFVVLIKQALNEVRHLLHPRGVFVMRLNDTPINKDVVYSVFGFFFLYLSTVAIVALIVSTHSDMLTSISAGFAMVGNIGPGFGTVGPAENYAHMPSYVLYTLSMAMLMGRLEIYTFFALFTPYFWRSFK